MRKSERWTELDLQINEQRRNPAPNTFSNHTPDPGAESDLLNKCLEYCRERGYPVWHDRSRGKNQPGWPDLIIFMPGAKVILIELKSIKGIFRQEQQQLARQFMYLGHEYHKIKSWKRFVEIVYKNNKL